MVVRIRRGCKDLFSCLLIVIAYLFIMKIPRPTGTQSLTGIRVMATEHVIQQPAIDLTAGGQLTNPQDPMAMLLAMAIESNRSITLLTGVVAQLQNDFRTLQSAQHGDPRPVDHQQAAIGQQAATASQDSIGRAAPASLNPVKQQQTSSCIRLLARRTRVRS